MKPINMAAMSSLLLVAHPGHELVLHGWVRRARPVVCVLTDGSGFAGRSRIDRTARWLESAGATAGSIFGRLTDREAYTKLLDGGVEWIDSLVTDLSRELVTSETSMVVADAAEGFNPVHDLCRLIAGAAISLAANEGVRAMHYEYPIHEGPRAYDEDGGEVVRLDLDDAGFAMKLADARAYADVIPDVLSMISDLGEEAFRRETFRPVEDWTAFPWPPHERPLYERFGEERVASKKYDRVVRHSEHILPLLDHLRARAGAAGIAVSRP